MVAWSCCYMLTSFEKHKQSGADKLEKLTNIKTMYGLNKSHFVSMTQRNKIKIMLPHTGDLFDVSVLMCETTADSWQPSSRFCHIKLWLVWFLKALHFTVGWDQRMRNKIINTSYFQVEVKLKAKNVNTNVFAGTFNGSESLDYLHSSMERPAMCSDLICDEWRKTVRNLQFRCWAEGKTVIVKLQKKRLYLHFIRGFQYFQKVSESWNAADLRRREVETETVLSFQLKESLFEILY